MMSEYTYMKDGSDVIACDCCQAVAPVKVFTRRDFTRGQTVRDKLCQVCASTMIANAWTYPDQHADADIFTTIGFCTNLILDAVTQRRKDLPK